MSSTPWTRPAAFSTLPSDIVLISRDVAAPEAIRVRLRVPKTARFLEGHFEGDPIVPAVAELSAMVLPAIASQWPECGSLRALRGLRFELPVRPEEEVELTVERRGETIFRFALRRGGERCAVGQIEVGGLPTDEKGAEP